MQVLINRIITRKYYGLLQTANLKLVSVLVYTDLIETSLLKRLANKFINVIEVVPTTTELTFIVHKCDTDKVVLEMTKLL